MDSPRIRVLVLPCNDSSYAWYKNPPGASFTLQGLPSSMEHTDLAGYVLPLPQLSRVKKIAVPWLFPSAGKHDKLPVLVHNINAGKPAVLHPRKLHREFLVPVKRVPPVQYLFLIFR